MRKLFQRRRLDFLERCSKYLRYVLNDHFVLVLMVFLGFLSLQYRQLLLNFPENTWSVGLSVLVINGLLLFVGRLAIYVEDADQVFLLPKEKEVSEEVRTAAIRSFLLWSGIQILLQLILVPIYLKLGLTVWMIVLYVLGLLGMKIILIRRQMALYQSQNVFDWSEAIEREQKRKQTILRFFALFTTVKGITTTVKRRGYLDTLLNLAKKKQGQTWFYLYLRAFLRAGDYLGLTVRLLLLAILSVIAIEESWISIGLVVVFHYLLLFQLLGLYKHYDYQYLTQLYPLDGQRRKVGFQRLLRVILYGLLAVEVVIALLFSQEKIMVIFLPLIGIFLHEVYLPLKLKKLID
ncbi:ABC transporter permease [Streptococcus ruminantium]|uniref:ABC transporter permease n=1 Tax=Streptococcus ruminantium TaxID=1917441 RepID=UPI0012DD5093|nr:ABC transporter permease [Streptococcus ruminantium]